MQVERAIATVAEGAEGVRDVPGGAAASYSLPVKLYSRGVGAPGDPVAATPFYVTLESCDPQLAATTVPFSSFLVAVVHACLWSLRLSGSRDVTGALVRAPPQARARGLYMSCYTGIIFRALLTTAGVIRRRAQTRLRDEVQRFPSEDFQGHQSHDRMLVEMYGRDLQLRLDAIEGQLHLDERVMRPIHAMLSPPAVVGRVVPSDSPYFTADAKSVLEKARIKLYLLNREQPRSPAATPAEASTPALPQFLSLIV